MNSCVLKKMVHTPPPGAEERESQWAHGRVIPSRKIIKCKTGWTGIGQTKQFKYKNELEMPEALRLANEWISSLN